MEIEKLDWYISELEKREEVLKERLIKVMENKIILQEKRKEILESIEAHNESK